jgi:hypothetical protein
VPLERLNQLLMERGELLHREAVGANSGRMSGVRSTGARSLARRGPLSRSSHGLT